MVEIMLRSNKWDSLMRHSIDEVVGNIKKSVLIETPLSKLIKKMPGI